MANEFDYHFLILAPGLPGSWFTQAARNYWLKFQPIMTENPELLAFTPPDATIAVTLLARRDNASSVSRRINALHRDLSNVYLDLIIADSLPELEAALNQRATSNQPFGEREEQA